MISNVTCHDILFNFLYKSDGIKVEYVNKNLVFTNSQYNHVNYIIFNNNLIHIFLSKPNTYSLILKFINLLKKDNTLEKIIYKFEKELLKNYE